ncbi:IPT/TIG domain-containing protein [Corallibacter sp.]|uniref:IPT/TIG domain-containing protein n=1 Tax=Corallibacter sp. TaxID=2038084 RepID=UPI003A90AAFB
MKNLKFKRNGLILVMILSLVAFFSCDSDDDNDLEGQPPVINSVSTAVGNEQTDVGFANNMYVIRGLGFASTQKVFFNEVDTYFNATLVTDKVIIVQIDEDTPYLDTTNELKVVTANGTATYPFIVAPPAPRLKSFNPVNAADGETITVYGSFFIDPVVTVGDVEVEVLNLSINEFQIVLPSGSDREYISVETISGNSISQYAIGTAIYDDIWYDGWDIESWNNQEYITNGDAAQGLTYFKKDMTGWDNIQGNWSWNDQLEGYSGIRFSVRADEPGKLKFVFNGNWDDATAPNFDVTTEWVQQEFTWEELQNATFVQNISFQEYTGNGGVYHFDNFGYVLEE